MTDYTMEIETDDRRRIIQAGALEELMDLPEEIHTYADRIGPWDMEAATELGRIADVLPSVLEKAITSGNGPAVAVEVRIC
jgi:hypothetical protein